MGPNRDKISVLPQGDGPKSTVPGGVNSNGTGAPSPGVIDASGKWTWKNPAYEGQGKPAEKKPGWWESPEGIKNWVRCDNAKGPGPVPDAIAVVACRNRNVALIAMAVGVIAAASVVLNNIAPR